MLVPTSKLPKFLISVKFFAKSSRSYSLLIESK
jgi:hypothetical protein